MNITYFFHKSNLDYYYLLTYNLNILLIQEVFMSKNNFIYSYIRKICIRSAIISAIAMLIVFAIAHGIPFNDVFSLPTMSFANSAATVYDSGVEYVEVTLNNAKYTGFDCIKRGKVYASYYYSLINNQCTFILVKNSSSKPLPDVLNNYTIQARLLEINDLSENMMKDFSENIGWTPEGLRKVSSHVIIDETAYHIDVYYYLALCLLVIIIMFLSFTLVNIFYAFVPKFSPPCMTFNRLSEREHNIAHVNFELSSRIILQSGNITLTENYIVTTGPLSIEIVPINKIVWAYEHSTWHHILWFKIKLTYTLHILCKHRIYIYSPRNTKEDIDTVINYLQDNYPNVIFGYTKENKKAAYRKRL